MGTHELDAATSELLASVVRQLRECPISAREQALTQGLRVLSETTALATPRGVEEVCTRLGTSSLDIGGMAERVADDDTQSNTVRALAATTSAIAFRRALRAERSRAAVSKLRELAPSWPYLQALLLQLEALTYLDSTPTNLRLGLQLSRRAAEAMPDNPGARHAHAQFLLDNTIWNPVDSERSMEMLRKALSEVDTAIGLQDWAKFHITRGRILLRLAPADAPDEEGLAEIELAIQREGGDAFDRERRAMTYAWERALVDMRRESVQTENRLRTEAAKFTAQMELQFQRTVLEEGRRSLAQMISIIAFITSLLALVQFASALFSTVQEWQSQNTASVWDLIALLLAFTCVMMATTFMGSWLINRNFARTLRDLRAKEQR